MIRIMVRTLDGPPTSDPRVVTFKSFEIEFPELEAFFECKPSYGGRDIVGVEIIPKKESE